MDNRTFLETWFSRIWVKGDLNAVDEMIGSDVTVRGLTDAPQMSKADLREFCAALLGVCDFSAVDIEHFMDDGIWSQVLVTFRGKARANGSPLNIDAQIMVRISDGKIVEAYNHPDFISLFQQLGTYPADAIMRGISGAPAI